jgi:hypothetical protein
MRGLMSALFAAAATTSSGLAVLGQRTPRSLGSAASFSLGQRLAGVKSVPETLKVNLVPRSHASQ